MNNIPSENATVTVLIVVDNENLLMDIHQLLKGEGYNIHNATSDKEAMQKFEKIKPDVLILAYTDLEEAVVFYLKLIQVTTNINDIPHKSIMLCHRSEAAKAAEFCTRGVIDEYMIFRPLYDPYRLKIAVANVRTRSTAKAHLNILEKQLGSVLIEMEKFGGFVHQFATDGNDIQTETENSYTKFAHILGNKLDSFRQQLSILKPQGSEHKKEEAELKEFFEKFKQEQLNTPIESIGEERKNVNKNLSDRFEKQYAQYEQILDGFKKTQHLKQRSVLVVDDDDIYLEVVASALEYENFIVHKTTDGREVLSLLPRVKPDIILMDFEMPGISGAETIKQIRSNRNFQDIPIIMLTGHGDKETVFKSIEAGAADFVVKPSDRKTLLKKINSLLEV